MRSGKSAAAVIVCLLFLMSGLSGFALEAPEAPFAEMIDEAVADPSAESADESSEELSDSTPEETMDDPLSLWTEDAAAKNELLSYMEAVTDEAGEDYIPVDHRVAVFDLDGTLFCETDPNYFDYCLLKYRVLDDPDYKDIASDFEREVALKIQEQNETGASFEGLEVDHGRAVASAFAGMTPDQFNAYIQEFKKQPMPNYDGMARGDGWYLPMLQVVEYLKANDFTVYIVSGTDRFIVRGIVDDSPLDLPPWQIIGSDETLVAADQGETDGLSYVYDEDDALVLGGDFIVKNLKMNKVTVIAQEIGVQPVLSFGNSTGDSSMAAYVTSGNPFRSLAFMLCCDDTERENGNVEKADKMFDLCGTYGWVPVSMKNDWTTIYGDDVTYLGVPHPTEATDPAEILTGMTVEQKLAQMTMVAFNELDGAVAKCLSDTQPGGILLFAGNTPSAADTAALTAELQQLALGTSGIPLLISIDQEGGYVVRMTESTWFPGNMALAATGDTENAFTAASIIGEELQACGINVDFGPVVDVNVNPANPVIGVRSFGEDPETVAAFGAAYVNGLHEAGVISSLKHFPGHGDTDTDSHTGLPSVDKSLDELRSFELVPFQSAIEAGADMVMTAHIVYPQVETDTVVSAADGEEVYIPATLSPAILTELLRDEMGFEGVIVTDSLIMDAIADNFGHTEAAAMAIQAGADILLDPIRLQTEEDCETYEQLIHDLAALVEQGSISEERLDESVLRILELKDKYGILDREQYGTEPEAAIENAQTVVNIEEHKAVELEITEQAITLLKNDGMIPYDASDEDKIVVLTAWDSEAPAAEYGMQSAVEAGAIPAGADIEVVSYDERRIGDVSEAIDGASLCIILSRMGSEAYLDPTAATGAAGTLVDIVIDRVHEQDGKVIVVSVQLPYDTARYPEADAIIAAYNPIGSRSLVTEDTEETAYNYAPNIPAALRMIFDGTPMPGKLPVSVPALTEDYGFSDEILYPAGFSVFEGEAAPDKADGVRVETVEGDSFSMDYVTFGHGEKTLVILPGLSVQSVMGSADAIAEAYDLFTKDYTVYLFDRRKELPDAYSVQDMARDTAEAIRALGVAPVSLMGVSQGGMIAMDIAIRYPELVEKLVLGSTSACVTEEQYQTMDAWVKLAASGDAEGLYLAFGEALYPEEMFEESTELLVEAAKTVTAEDLERFIVLAEGSSGFDVSDELEQISCPVLLIGSVDDQVLGADATAQIAERLDGRPGFELYMYDGYGHAAYDTAPDYKERVLGFLASGSSH